MTFLPLVQKIENNIVTHQLIQQGDSILVCVSGGCDSVALLHMLLELQSKWKYRLHILHFDHGLRQESPAERAFVETLAEQNDLPCHTWIATHLAQETTGIQEKSRQWRLQVSEKFRAEIGGQRIATAHHADDQAETFLHKLLRGCHLANLRGMAWQNGFYIHPLLNCTKAELQQYLQSKSQGWMEDHSNQSSKYLRNRIRLELIPLMNDLARGELDSRLHDLSEQSKQLKDWIAQSGKDWGADEVNQNEDLLVEELQQTPLMLQSALLHRYLLAHGINGLAYGHIRKILRLLQTNKNQWECHLPGKKIVRREGKKLFVCSRQPVPSQKMSCHSFEITNHLGAEWEIQCRILEQDETFPQTGVVLFNIPPKSCLTFSYREAGDRFCPHWKNKPVKLKDFLRDQSIPLHQRGQLPLIRLGKDILVIYPQFRAKVTYFNQQQFLPLHLLLTSKKDG